jgi:hypothetical protein
MTTPDHDMSTAGRLNPAFDEDSVIAYLRGHSTPVADHHWPIANNFNVFVRHLLEHGISPVRVFEETVNHPNPNFRKQLAMYRHLPASVVTKLLTDPNGGVQDYAFSNNDSYREELHDWWQTAPTDTVLRALPELGTRLYLGNAMDLVDKLMPRLQSDPALMGGLLKHLPSQVDKAILDKYLDTPNLPADILSGLVHAYSQHPVNRRVYDGLFDKIMEPAYFNVRGKMLSKWIRMNRDFGSDAPTHDQIQRILTADAQTPPDSTDDDGPSLASTIGFMMERQRQFPTFNDDNILFSLTNHRRDSIRKLANQRLGPTAPDRIHTERVAVRFDTGKLRAIRDLILESGKDSLPAKDLPPMEWETPVRDEYGNVVKRKVLKRSGKEMKEVEEVVKKPLPVRDGKGHISASMIQAYIDALPAIEFNVSHGKQGAAARHMIEYYDAEAQCPKCKGSGQESIAPMPVNLGGSFGTVTVDKQRCSNCDGSGFSQPSIPDDNFWSGAQRHSTEDSKVFQLNITDKHVQAMRAKNSWQTYRNQADAVHATGHPVRPERTTIGWVRYTGTPKEGIHIDEIQSDFGQSFVRVAVAQARDRAEAQAREAGLQQGTKEYNEFVENHVHEMRSHAESKWPDEHNKHIADVLFGGRHSNEVIHEAFHQYLRDRGFVGAKIAIHTAESKGPLSGLETNRPFPAHFKITYHDVPKKMAYKPSRYGSLPTQNSKELKSIEDRKPKHNEAWAESNQTWEGIIRKYESESYGLDCFFAKADELDEMAQKQFDADARQKWYDYFLNPETSIGDVVDKLRGYHPSPQLELSAPYMAKILAANENAMGTEEEDFDRWATVAHWVVTHPQANDDLRETVWNKLKNKYEPGSMFGGYTDAVEKTFKDVLARGSDGLRRKVFDFYAQHPDKNVGRAGIGRVTDALFNPYLANFTPKTAGLILEYNPVEPGTTTEQAIRSSRVHSVLVETLRNKGWAGSEWARPLFDKMALAYSANPEKANSDIQNVLGAAMQHGSADTARSVLFTPRGANELGHYLNRSDLTEDDIQSILESKLFPIDSPAAWKGSCLSPCIQQASRRFRF